MTTEDKGYFPEDVQIQKRSDKHKHFGAKVFIVFVEGFETSDIKKVHRSRVLSRVVVEEGVWGETSLDPQKTRFVGFAPFFTGNLEGHGPSVLAAADRVTIIGKPDLFDVLKLPRSNRLHVKYPDETFLSGQGGKLLDNVVVNYTIELAKNNELWDERLKREVVIVHLTAMRHICKKEGHKSIGGAVALDDTFEQLDILFSQLREKNYRWDISYFVTSIGAKVPIIAWGRCIDKTSIQDKILLYQRKPRYSVPTAPRNMDMLSMAPLIACILGTFPPPNSVGYLPVNFLETIDSETAICQSEIVTILKTLYRQQTQHVLRGGWANLASFDQEKVSQRKLENLSQRVKVNFKKGDYNAVATFSKIFTLVCPAFSETGDDNMDGTILISTVGMNSFPAWYQVYVAAAVLPWWLAIRNGKNVMKLIQAVCNQSGNPRRNVMGLVYFILILLTGSLTDNNIHIYIVSMAFICASEVLSISSKSKVTLWMFSALPMVTSLSYNYSESTIHQWKILTLFLQVVVSWTLTTDDLFVLSNTLYKADDTIRTGLHVSGSSIYLDYLFPVNHRI
ncbi:hypothetical protein GE061_011896 [Apolygus lucorum]|uniref:GPI ethanolamine phosphate transferase 1 n=1 Tax=Apolygus lucorum TaxID=248454 RepID=A0A8S9XRY9_APOLU|nr:hypothetical protein GE061_011896 [Apolygus lucorum]